MTPKPRGRHQVREAVLQAATELFALRGMAGVSIREIAARAGVNHGLIHRHFGSKQELRRAVQDRAAARVRAGIAESDDFEETLWSSLEALAGQESFVRLLAAAFLEGDSTGDVQEEFPLFLALLARVRRFQDEGRLPADIDPRHLVAGGMGMALGLTVFGPYVFKGVGLGRGPADLRLREVFASWLKLPGND